MSRTIDEKVVEMRFDNSNFESNVKQSMSTLDRLKSSLKFSESAKSFENIDRAASKVSFAGINKGIVEVRNNFSKLDMITNTVLSRMTNAAIDFGTKIVTAIPAQIKSGGLQRALNIEQAKFQLEGLGKTWDQVKDDINYGVEDTAYGLDSAAKAAAQLSASGVEFGDSMRKTLRGISGVAAMTNTSYDEIAQVYEAIAGMGKVTMGELNRLSIRGVNAVAELSKALKKPQAEIRDMISKGKIDFQTFSDAMDDAFGEHAKDANKTFTGALSNMKAALSRIGEAFYGPTLVNLRDLFNQLRDNFKDVKEFLDPVVDGFVYLSTKVFHGLNGALKTFSDYWRGGFEGSNKRALLIAMSNVVLSLKERLEAVGKAFREVFGYFDKDDVGSIAQSFIDFSNKIRPSEKELEGLTYVFKGLFTILKGLGTAFKVVLALIAELGPKLTPIITIGGSIILTIVVLDKLVSKVRMFGHMLLNILPLIKVFGIALLALAGGFAAFLGIKALIENFDKVKEFFTNIGKSIKDWYQNLEKSNPVLYKVFDTLKLFGQSVLEIFKKIGEFFKNLPSLFGDYTWTDVLNKINEGLGKFVEKLKSVNIIETVKGWIHNFGEALRKVGEKISNNPLFKGLGDLVKRLGEFISGIKKVETETVEVVDKFRGAANNITGHNVKIGETADTVETFADKLKKFREEVTLGKVVAVAFAATFTALIGSVAFATAKIGGGIGKLTSSAASLIDNFKKKVFGGLNKPKLSTLEQFAVLIGVLAASLVALTLVDQDKLMNAVKIIGIFTAALAGVAILLHVLPSKGSTDTLGIAGIGIAIAAIAASLLILDQIKDIEGAYKKVGIIALIMAAMGVTVAIINKAGKGSLRSAIVIVALGLAMKGIAQLCNIINDISGDPQEMATKLLGLVAVMLGFGLLAAGIGQIRISSAIGLFLIITILKQVMPQIEGIFDKLKVSEQKFRQVNDLLREYRDNIITFAAIAAGIIVALGFAGKGIGKIGLGFLFMAAGFIVIGFALQKISDIVNNTDPGVLQKATNILIGMMVFVGVLTLLCGIFAKNDIGKSAVRLGAMMLMISVAMLIMVGVVSLLGNIDDSGLTKGLIALGVLGVIIALIVGVSSATKDIKMGPILALLASLVLMSAMLVVLSFIPWQDLVAPIIGIGVIFGGIAAVFSQIAKVKTTDKQGVKAMIFFLAMLGEIIAGIILISRLAKDWTTIAAAAAGMSGCIIALAVAMRIISKTKISKANAENFALASLAMLSIGTGLAATSGSNWGNILSTAGSMAGLVFVLVKALEAVKDKKISINNVKNFVYATLALLPIGAALAFSTFSSPGQILSAALGIGIVIAALTGSLVALNKWGGNDIEGKAKALLKASLILIPVTAAILVLAKYGDELKAGPVIALMAILAEIAIALGVLTKKTDSGDIDKTANSLLKASLVLGPAVLALIALAKYGNELQPGPVIALMGLLAEVAVMLGILTKKTDSGDLDKSAKALLKATLAIIPVTIALVALARFAGDLKAGPVIALMAIFAEVAVALGVLTKVTGKAQVESRAEALLVATVSLIPVAASLVALSKFAGELKAGPVIALMAIFAEVAVALGLLTKLTKGLDLVASATGLLIATISLIPVAGALVMLSQFASELDIGQVLAVVGLFAEVAIALGLLTIFTNGLDIIASSAALVIAAFSLIEVAYAFKLLSEAAKEVDIAALNQMLTEWFAVIAIITIIMGLVSMIPGLGQALDLGMIAVAGAMAIMAFAVVELAAAFTIASIGFKIFVPVLEQFIMLLPQLQEAMSWDMVGAMVQLAIGLAAIGAAGIVAGIGAIGLWAFGAALTSTFVPAIMSIKELGSEDISAVGQKLTELMSALEPLKGVSAFLIPAAIAFALLGVALMTAGIGINQGAQGLMMLAPALMMLQAVGDIGGLLNSIGLGLILIGAAGIVLGIGANGLTAAASSLPQIFNSLIQASVLGADIGATLATIGQGLLSLGLAGIILNMGGAGLKLAADALSVMVPALQQLNNADLSQLGEQIKIIADHSLELAGVGIVLGTGAAGMGAMGTALGAMAFGMNAITTAFQNVKAAIDDIFAMDEANMAAQIIQKYQDIGRWIPESIAQGIYSAMDVAVTAAQEMSAAIEETGVRDVLDIHSVSPKFIEIAKWICKSLGVGISEEKWTAISEAESMSQAISMVLAECAGQVKGYMKSILGQLGLMKGVDTKIRINSKEDYLAWKEAKEKSEGIIGDLKEMFPGVSDVIDQVKEATEGATEGMDGFADSMGSAGSAAGGAKDAFSDLKGTIESQMDLFSEFNMKTEMTGEQMLNNMRSQIQGISTWAANMQQLAMRGMAPGLLKKLGDLGPQGFEKVNAFMQMTQEQLAEANSLYAQSLVLPGSAASQVAGSYGYAGQMANQGFIDEIGNGEMGNAAYQAAIDAGNQFNLGLGVESPSKVTTETGYYTVLGFQVGMNKGMPGLLQAVDTNMQRLVDQFNSYTTQGGPFTLIGQSIQQAILTGITNAGMMATGAMETVSTDMSTGMSANPLLTAFLGSFTYEAGVPFLTDFIEGIKQGINDAFGLDGKTSTWSNELFLMFLQGILDCIEENYEDFEDNVEETFLTPIQEKIEEYIGYDAGYDLGKSTAEGLIDGMMDMLEDVKEAAKQLGDAAAAATSGSLEVNSPSHVFQRIGHSINEGLALGIKDTTYVTTRSLSKLSDGMTNRMNTVVSTIASMINSSIDMQPTISPVLDTTNIANGVKSINGIFATTNRNASLAASGYDRMLNETKLQAALNKSSESKLQRDYTQALIDAINKSANTDTNVNVVLEGDAAGVFNLVRSQNDAFTSNTRYNPLSHQAYSS